MYSNDVLIELVLSFFRHAKKRIEKMTKKIVASGRQTE